jgi:hypothetical protein
VDIQEDLGDVNTVIANEEVMSILQTTISEDFDFEPPCLMTMGELRFVGKVLLNGQRALCYIHERMPHEEMLLMGHNGCAELKIENFLA